MAGRSLSPRIAGSASDSNPLAQPDLRIASIALARVLTLDHRHFAAVKPVHCGALRLLPE